MELTQKRRNLCRISLTVEEQSFLHCSWVKFQSPRLGCGPLKRHVCQDRRTMLRAVGISSQCHPHLAPWCWRSILNYFSDLWQVYGWILLWIFRLCLLHIGSVIWCRGSSKYSSDWYPQSGSADLAVFLSFHRFTVSPVWVRSSLFWPSWVVQ